MYELIWSVRILSYILEMAESTEIGLKLSLLVESSFLKTGETSPSLS